MVPFLVIYIYIWVKLIARSVGAHFIYGSWYTQAELGKRAAVFCGFGNLGNMAGGWIQAALLGSLSDKGGLPPWRWMFIVVAVMTIPFALFGEFVAACLVRDQYLCTKYNR